MQIAELLHLEQLGYLFGRGFAPAFFVVPPSPGHGTLNDPLRALGCFEMPIVDCLTQPRLCFPLRYLLLRSATPGRDQLRE